jgi:pyochelin biosynthetic protein PchC
MTLTSDGERTPSRWLRHLGGPDDPAARLVCLPHAGGSPTFFRDWPGHLDGSVEILAVCYPGRQDRFAEPCVTDMGEMAAEVARALLPLTDRPLALFGHSMGATVGFEAARILRDEHGVTLACLLVSGAVPPHLVPRGTRHTEGDDALVADILEQGATESAMLADPEMREFLMPAIRGDYRLIETYEFAAGGAPLDTPVVAYYGEQDTDAAVGAAEWGRLTHVPVEAVALPGGHFYLQDERRELLADVGRRIAAGAPHSAGGEQGRGQAGAPGGLPLESGALDENSALDVAQA